MTCQREQPEDRRADRDEYRSQTDDAGIEQRFDQRLAFGMLLLDGIAASSSA